MDGKIFELAEACGAVGCCAGLSRGGSRSGEGCRGSGTRVLALDRGDVGGSTGCRRPPGERGKDSALAREALGARWIRGAA